MPKRRYKQIPIDQSLRARALEIVAFHQREFASPSPASASPTSHALAAEKADRTPEVDCYDKQWRQFLTNPRRASGCPRSGSSDLGTLRVNRETQSAAHAAQSAPGSCRHDASQRDRSSCDPDGGPRRAHRLQHRGSCGATYCPTHRGWSQ